ncbi:MAG TPA: hypothetical protein VH500_19050 [Nitrososphaeraceae archaeon]|jgi:hypothetical protein
MILAYSAVNIIGRIVDSDKNEILSQIKDETKVIIEEQDVETSQSFII